MSGDPLLTIIIPTYNEAIRLPETLLKISSYLKRAGLVCQILVVDDGSTDNTCSLVEELQPQMPCLQLLRSDRNYGKGHAVKMGVLHSTGSYVLMSDADLSTPIEEFDRFLPFLESGFKVVIGTRKKGEAQILLHQPFWRESMGKVFTELSNIFLGLRVSDFTCGFKAFERQAGQQIFSRQRIDGFAFDSETIFLANQLQFTIKEIPVIWKNSPDTRVRIVRDTFLSLYSLFQIRWNHISGKYQ